MVDLVTDCLSLHQHQSGGELAEEEDALLGDRIDGVGQRTTLALWWTRSHQKDKTVNDIPDGAINAVSAMQTF